MNYSAKLLQFLKKAKKSSIFFTFLEVSSQRAHDTTKQGAQSYDGTQFLFHHVKDDGFGHI